MKKWILGINFILVISVILCSCGKAASEQNSPKKEAEIIVMTKADGSPAKDPVPTDEEYAICESCIDEIYKEIKEYDDRGYKEENDISEAVEAVYNLAKKWEEKGYILSLENYGYYVYVKFKGGINYLYYPAYDDVCAAGDELSVDVYSLQPHKTEFSEKREAVFSAYNASTDGAAKKIADTFDSYIWKYDLDDKEVTFNTVANFGDNEVILWSGHGAYAEWCGPVLMLTQTIYDYKYTGDACYNIANNGCYYITNEFIDLYVGDLSNTFLYISACMGLKDNRLVEAFSQKNAEAIVANTETISIIYSGNIMASVIDSMVSGNNLEIAMNEAKSIHGEHDATIYTSHGATDYSYPTVYKGGDFKFGNVVLDTLEDGTYFSDYDYTASLSNDNEYLSLDSALWHYDDKWNQITDYEKKNYNLPISSHCEVDIFEFEQISTTLHGAADFMTEWFESGNQLGFSITVKDGEIIKFIFSS